MLVTLVMTALLACDPSATPQHTTPDPADHAEKTPPKAGSAPAPEGTSKSATKSTSDLATRGEHTSKPFPEADRPEAPEVTAARVLVQDGKAPAAQAALETWLKAHPTDVDAQYWRGRSLLEQSKWKEAEAQLLVVIEAAPTWANPRSAMGAALSMQRRCEDALPHLDKLVELSPEHPHGYFNRGHCRYVVGQVDEAIADANRACALGHTRACDLVPRLEKRKKWMEGKKAEAAAKAKAEGAAPAGDGAPPPGAEPTKAPSPTPEGPPAH
jgi:Flp pilus assembly protein TadD